MRRGSAVYKALLALWGKEIDVDELRGLVRTAHRLRVGELLRDGIVRQAERTVRLAPKGVALAAAARLDIPPFYMMLLALVRSRIRNSGFYIRSADELDTTYGVPVRDKQFKHMFARLKSLGLVRSTGYGFWYIPDGAVDEYGEILDRVFADCIVQMYCSS